MKLLLFYLYLVVHVTGDEEEREMICGSSGFKVVQAKFGKEMHVLCLKMTPLGSSSLASPLTALLLDPDSEEDTRSIRALPLVNVTMALGFPMDNPISGSAEGYLGDDHNFYGVLHLGNRTLHADPYDIDQQKDYGVFDGDSLPPPLPASLLMMPPRVRRDNARVNQLNFSDGTIDLLNKNDIPYHVEGRQRLRPTRARICDLFLLADREFFEKDANSSLNHVVLRMMHAVAQADIIFRNSDFNNDGVPDNIGFAVKYILVLTSKETDTRVFGDLVTKSGPIEGREYLMRFARLRRLSEVCLGIAFSGRAFLNRTLGLSFTSLGGGLGGAAGGLCDRRAYGRSFNTLAIAHSTTECTKRVPERVAALTLAHEIGHSFGALHDDYFPNKECRGYLMGAQSAKHVSSRNFEFSICSKELIASALSSMSYCLTDDGSPYCGNGIVEEGETCDCGLPSRCSLYDPCCTPRAGGALVSDKGTQHIQGCSVAPPAMCHPSQGLCCTPKCQFADLSNSGIECKTQYQKCTCTNDTASCLCGLGGRCLEDGSCHAAECALLGLRECQCAKEPGGTLSREDMCGVCCRVEGTDDLGIRCIGAEQAAIEAMAAGNLPDIWPDPYYSGPNVSVRLCKGAVCRIETLRAWHGGDACVTFGEVGVCSSRGVCTRFELTPRSNVYPDVMRLKSKSKAGSTIHIVSLQGHVVLTLVSHILYLWPIMRSH